MKQRNAQYEFIRTAAMVLVIGVHTLANIPAETAFDVAVSRILTPAFFLCNGLFFMLSGRFALAGRFDSWEDTKLYYLKKLVGLGVPMLVYMLLRTFYDYGFRYPGKTMFRQYLLNVLGAYSSVEFWFLYVLSGMLVLAPLIAGFLQRADQKQLWLVLGIAFGYNILKLYLPELGIAFSWKCPMGGEMFFFILGYALERVVTEPRQRHIVYGLGAASLVITVIQEYLGFAPGITSTAPTYVFMLAAAFLGLKELYSSGGEGDRVFCWIGKYSLSVYMVHVIVLDELVEKIQLPVYLLRGAAVLVLTTVISLVIGFAMDNLLVRPLQKLARRILGLDKK